MRIRPALLWGAAFAMLLLAGCGKKAAPVVPGPPNEVIYPRLYPNIAIQQD